MLCETSSKKQCPDCYVYWEIGIAYWLVGICSTPSQSTKKLDKKNFDALSFPSYFIKKNMPFDAKHGASERQRMNYKAKDMLQKARRPKHGGYTTILERWHNGGKYRDSLSKIGWSEEQIIHYEKLALEDHSFFAEKSWVPKLNNEGAHGQLCTLPFPTSLANLESTSTSLNRKKSVDNYLLTTHSNNVTKKKM